MGVLEENIENWERVIFKEIITQEFPRIIERHEPSNTGNTTNLSRLN